MASEVMDQGTLIPWGQQKLGTGLILRECGLLVMPSPFLCVLKPPIYHHAPGLQPGSLISFFSGISHL